MKIRVATEQDWNVIIEIYNQAVDEKFCTADTDHITIDTRGDWLRQHSNGDYPIWVCEVGGVVRGWCSLSPYRQGRKALRTIAEISYYVHKDFRRMKIGDTLVKNSIFLSKKLGFKNLIAILLEPNIASINLLKNYGFLMWGFLPDVADFDGTLCSQCIYGRKLE